MICTDIMQDASEVVCYDHPKIPLYIRTAILSDYPDKRALCHWHDDLEWIRIRSGSMNYYVDGCKILLQEGDCLLVNSRRMHYGYSFCQKDCSFSCILFHPQLFSGSQTLYQSFILPVLENQQLNYLVFPAGEDKQQTAALLDEIVSLKESGFPAYELTVISILYTLWRGLWQYAQTSPQPKQPESNTDLIVQRNMVSYIQQHYSEKLTLADIASSGHICRSKCCLIFRSYLQQTPIEFLNSYRLKMSCRLLTSTSKNITQIAMACGFHHSSYYSKLFVQSYGCTPREYRFLHTGADSPNL